MWRRFIRDMLGSPQPPRQGWGVEAVAEETATDPGTGETVLVRPFPPAVSGWSTVGFMDQERAEAHARLAMQSSIPHTVRVRAVAPRIVYDLPPSVERPDTMAVGDAVVCLLQLCETLAHAHAAGWAGLRHGPSDVRIHEGQITVVLPHLPGDVPGSSAYTGGTSVQDDVATAIGLLSDLLAGGGAGSLRRMYSTFDDDQDLDKAPVLPEYIPLIAALDGDVPTSAVELAERLLPLAPSDWSVRVARLPRVTDVSPAIDWDRLIELGQEAIAELEQPPRGLVEAATRKSRDDRYIRCPLGAALHHRAVMAYQRGDLVAALTDLERAVQLDPWARSLTTRAMVHQALGNVAAAVADEDGAVSAVTADQFGSMNNPADVARAFYVRAVRRFRAADLPGAADDLRAATETLAECRGWAQPVPEDLIDRVMNAYARVHRMSTQRRVD